MVRRKGTGLHKQGRRLKVWIIRCCKLGFPAIMGDNALFWGHAWSEMMGRTAHRG